MIAPGTRISIGKQRSLVVRGVTWSGYGVSNHHVESLASLPTFPTKCLIFHKSLVHDILRPHPWLGWRKEEWCGLCSFASEFG